jgi:hypothetical protein
LVLLAASACFVGSSPIRTVQYLLWVISTAEKKATLGDSNRGSDATSGRLQGGSLGLRRLVPVNRKLGSAPMLSG